MTMLNSVNWREFYIKDIFPIIKRGKRLKNNDHISGRMPYTSSSAINNGIDDFIKNNIGVRIFSECMTIANSGSVGTCFYQPFEFVASDHVTKLENKYFNKYVYLFIATVASRLSEKYSFNREINDIRIRKEKIYLPVDDMGEPNYEFMEKFMQEKEEILLQKYKSYLDSCLDNLGGVKLEITKEWHEFAITDIFTIKPGKRLIKASMQNGYRPFIGASDSTNGITAFVSNTNVSIDHNVLGVNYNGSVVECFFHPYECIFSDDVKRFTLKNINGNKYIYLFIKSVILKQKEKYKYGYKFNETRMEKQKILLPVNAYGEPDYVFMERYMRQHEEKGFQRYADYLLINKRIFD